MTDKINRIEADDQRISNLVRSMSRKIPGYLDEKVTQAIIESGENKSRLSPKLFLWFRLSLSAASVIAIFAAAFFLLQPYLTNTANESIPPITEIKTHFEITNKNIKILWVQKKDFKLIRRQEQ